MKSTSVTSIDARRPATICPSVPRKWPWLSLLCAASLVLVGCDSGSSAGSGVDPGIIEIPVAYIKRPIPVDDQGEEVQADLRDPMLFSSGGDVYLRDSSAASAGTSNISRRVTGGIGDARGVNLSHDGTRLIFSLRLFDPDENDDVVPRWNIYEYDLTSKRLRAVIGNELTSELGDDLYPAYLPDGRIVFTSNRQRQAREMLINEGKPQFSALDEDGRSRALVLHVMNSDGSDIHQISFNQSHDLYPQVLSSSGKIVFTRWDNAVTDNGMHLYRVNPDGSEMEVLYGSNSHATGTGGAEVQFTSTREMLNGDLMVIAKPFSGTFDGGDIVIVDIDRFADNDKPIWPLAGTAGPAQSAATINTILNDGALSRGGRYASAYPLWDGSNRVLVSKSTCQIDANGVNRPCVEPFLSDNPNAGEASPEYAIWLYDMDVDTEKPLVLAERGMVMTEVIAARQRDLPPVITDKGDGDLDDGWEEDNVGVVNIRSVYDLSNGEFNGCFFGFCTPASGIDSVWAFSDPRNASASDRPARFVRFIKPVGIPGRNDPDLANPPDLNGQAFGPQRGRGMREILGYAPVEPDGSVKVKVPANVSMALEVLDAEGRRIGPEHLNWFQVQPGGTLNCVGCHDSDNGGATPEIHLRSGAMAPSINSGMGVSLQLTNTLIPGTATPYWGDLGQTMAEVRFDRASLTVPVSVQQQLSPDLVIEDYWTDPAVATPDPVAPVAYRYADLTPTPSPENSFCSPWEFNCRIIVNYIDNIHPIWQLDRGADADTPDAPDNPSNDDPTNTPLKLVGASNGIGDDTCIECHTSIDGARLPYGQLDLTTDPNQDANQFYRAFRELLFSDQGQFFNGATLEDFTVLVSDGMGGQVQQDDPVAGVSPGMTATGARRSYFIEKMTGVELEAGRAISGSHPHAGMLTGAELKLISEWLDLGAQNFNNPFDPAAPQN